MKYPLRLSVLLFGLFLIANSYFALQAEETENNVSKSSVWIIRADLDTADALPSNSGDATGELIGTYDEATHVLRFDAHFVSLSGPALNARFHGPAAIDRTAGATVAAARPEARLVSGTAWLDKEEEQDLLEGHWYFNTAKHPQGEIRGMVHATHDRSH